MIDTAKAPLTVREAAVKLRLSLASVYALCAAKKLRHARFGPNGGRIRIESADIEAYRKRQTVEVEKVGGAA